MGMGEEEELLSVAAMLSPQRIQTQTVAHLCEAQRFTTWLLGQPGPRLLASGQWSVAGLRQECKVWGNVGD